MKKKGAEGQRHKGTKENAKRRLFVFGPGIVAALTISFFVLSKNFPLTEQTPPMVERQSSVSGQKPSYAPELTFLITNQRKFHLTKEQLKLVKNLFKRYYEGALPVKKQLKESTAQLASYFSEKKKQSVKIASADIQKHSQEYQRLSGELSQLRHFYWEQGENLLTQTQKGIVEREIAKILSVKQPAFKKEAAP